jgi:TonB-dependent starch-binding outer membrane protein SusC
MFPRKGSGYRVLVPGYLLLVKNLHFMKKIIITILLSVVLTSVIRGVVPQVKSLTGTVTDASTGAPLPGVNIRIEGTITGASTNAEGKFSLAEPARGAVIVFSFIGYTEERVTYTGQTNLEIKLNQSVTALDDVVVIGYGTIKRSDLTGSVASVSKKEIEKTSPANITAALQGRVAGMMVTSVSGAPGTEEIIRLRGIGTLNNNDPIYVVDGTLIDNTDPNNLASNIRFLNPLDIESIEVLRDASAQAIYGSRGANGVILITTKKGTEGMPKVTFTSRVGLSKITRKPDVLNRDEFYDYILECYTNGYIRTIPNSGPDIPLETLKEKYPVVKQLDDEYQSGVYTDWLDEILKHNVINQNYHFSVTGGTKNARYGASAGYMNNEGLIENFNYKRYSFRLNSDYLLGKYLTFGENLGIAADSRKGTDDYAEAYYSSLWADPLVPVLKDISMVDPEDPDYEYNKYNVSGINSSNPVLKTKLVNKEQTSLTIAGNVFAELRLLKNLKFRSNYGFNIVFSDVSNYVPRYNAASNWANFISTLSISNFRTRGLLWENILSYSKTIKNHTLTALAGTTAEYTNASYQTATKKNTPYNDPEMRVFDAATSYPDVSGTNNINSMVSYLARINYSYGGKYLITASLRRDGSSKFGPDHKWGIFPSFSAGWILTNEKFFKDLNAGFIANLKLRAGWGQIGNSSLPSYYGYTSLVGTTSMFENYVFGETLVTGFYYKSIGSPDIKWETTEQTNIGIDIGFLKNSLILSADFFIKTTKDQLLKIQPPAYSGYSNIPPFINSATVKNRGLELFIEYKGNSGELNYTISANAATFKNKVTNLGANYDFIFNSPSRTEPGFPIGNFYGFVTDGIFQTDEEVLEHKGPGGTVLQPAARAGDMRFKNTNGDEKLNNDDRTWIGSPWPKFTYGINLSLGYKAFDLLLFAQGTYGNDLFFVSGSGTGNTNILKYLYERAWQGPGTSDSNPILSSVNSNMNFRYSDFHIYDGSYLRIKNLQLGYSIPGQLLQKISISECRIWAGCTNLITFTRYPGVDPDIGASEVPTNWAGHDWLDAFPQSREFQIGITATF